MNILVIGKPASGKGTLIKFLTQEFGNDMTSVIATGDLLREQIVLGTDIGKEVDILLKDGKFATDEMIFGLISEKLQKLPDGVVLFDGFPRNEKQARACLESMNLKFDCVFVLEASDELVRSRIGQRWVHKASGRSYGTTVNAPKNPGFDDITGEKLEKRVDDNDEILNKRLVDYAQKTAPIIDYFKEKNLNVIEVDANSPIVEQIRVVRDAVNKISSVAKKAPSMR